MPIWDPLLESKASEEKYWYEQRYGSQEPAVRKRLKNDIRPCTYMPTDEEHHAIVQHELFKKRLEDEKRYIDKYGGEQFKKSWRKIRRTRPPIKPSSNPFSKDQWLTEEDRKHPSFKQRVKQESHYASQYGKDALRGLQCDIYLLKAPIHPFELEDKIREHPLFKCLLYENFKQKCWYCAKCQRILEFDPRSRHECHHDKEDFCQVIGTEDQIKEELKRHERHHM